MIIKSAFRVRVSLRPYVQQDGKSDNNEDYHLVRLAVAQLPDPAGNAAKSDGITIANRP